MHETSPHPAFKAIALILSALSTAAMLYIGFFQTRAVQHMWCPVFGKGCEVVADSAIAHPWGIPDGYIAAVLYGMGFLLLLGPVQKLWISIPLLVIIGFATVAGIIGIWEMQRLGSFCFYCVITTAMSPVIFWAAWRLS